MGDGSRTFRLVTLGFLADGGDDYPFPDRDRVDLDLEEEDPRTGEATFAPDGSEQDTLAEYLFDNFNETPFDKEDVEPELDDRIQNLAFREDTVLSDDGNDGVNDNNGGDDDNGEQNDEPLSLLGTPEDDTLTGGNGNDTLAGKAGDDLLDSGAGDDVLFGAPGKDTLTGGDGNDLLRGQSGNDILEGGAGDDSLYGGNQFDRLGGGGGNDFLDGVKGITIYNGGAGSDLFVIHDDARTDWVQDFELGIDSIGLADDLTFEQLEITGRVNSFIAFQGQQIGVLLGVNPDDLDDSNFQEV